ncbi:hypothetical protein CJ191_01225 [Aerococcus viridans]|uniref:Uncharacterized protein n=1 Tax=Aerococcus viridans TaxID=1377 RepID=A0A2N6UFX4_9LACT|nr:hypothetical protein [Aerococcus viridans]PMC80457.1 hypothetical protein CJ191_01225 [Aerococcus viridans]
MKIKNGQDLYIVSNADSQETELITDSEKKAIDYINKQLKEEYGFTQEMIDELYEDDEVGEYYLLDCAPFKE